MHVVHKICRLFGSVTTYSPRCGQVLLKKAWAVFCERARVQDLGHVKFRATGAALPFACERRATFRRDARRQSMLVFRLGLRARARARVRFESARVLAR